MKKLLYSLFFLFSFNLLAQPNPQDLTIQTLDSLSNAFFETEDFSKALYYGEIALQKNIAVKGEMDSTTAIFMNRLGTCNMYLGNYEQCKSYWLKVKDIRALHLGTSHPLYSAILNNLVILYYNLGQYAEAVQTAEENLTIIKKNHGEDNIEYAAGLRNLAAMYMETHEYEKAEKLFLKALSIIEKQKEEFFDSYAMTLSNFAILYEYMGLFSKAEALYLKALANQSKAKDNPIYASFLHNLAVLYDTMGEYEQAEVYFLKALSIRKTLLGAEHPDYASSLSDLASLYVSLQRFEAAEPLLLQSKTLREKKLGKLHPSYAGSLLSLGNLYAGLGNLEQAKVYYLEATAILEKQPNHRFYFSVVNNLANTYRRTGAYELAEALYLKNLKTSKDFLTDGKYDDFITSLSGLALLYNSTNRYEKAEQTFFKVLEKRKEVYGEHHFSYFKDLNNLSYHYSDRGLYEKAITPCNLAISLNCKTTDGTTIQNIHQLEEALRLKPKEIEFYSIEKMLNTLHNLSILYQLLYKDAANPKYLKDAYLTNQLALHIYQDVQNSFSAGKDKLTSSKELLKFTKNALRTGLDLAKTENNPNYIKEIFRYAEQGKSIVLADVTKTTRAHNLGDLPDSLALQEQQFQQKKDELKKAALETDSETDLLRIQAQQNDLNHQIEAFLKSLKDKYPAYHALKYENITATVEDIQALLDEETLLLEYFVSSETTYIFAISKNNIELIPIAITKEDLSKEIKALRTALSDYNFIFKNTDKALNLYKQKASWFYKTIVQPALAHKKGFRQLIIIPDYELGHLPFEAFLTQHHQGKLEYNKLPYLLNEYQISYNYSATLWKHNLEHPIATSNGKLLACASDYKEQFTLTSLEKRGLYWSQLRTDLQDLPAAQNEVKQLSKFFDGRFLYHKHCNESTFKKEAPNYGIIHLAMHGILHPRVPILSSLAFTEDLDSLEDNFLQAYEISALNLKAELVVLSACETGYGKFEQGEGVISLARSFMYAGVPSLVVSLWQVNDQSTSLIMQDFYQNLALGMNKAEALRQAKLTYIQKSNGLLAHPAFWSAFIQLGDSHAIHIDKKRSLNWWLIGGLSLFLLLSFVSIKLFKKKTQQ